MATQGVMSPERAVHRVTGEIAEWYGIEAGVLEVGAPADMAVIDPAGLNDELDAYHEAPIAEFGGLSRMVRRNDQAVRATIIGGTVAWNHGSFSEGFGRDYACGRFLAPATARQERMALASK